MISLPLLAFPVVEDIHPSFLDPPRVQGVPQKEHQDRGRLEDDGAVELLTDDEQAARPVGDVVEEVDLIVNDDLQEDDVVVEPWSGFRRTSDQYRTSKPMVEVNYQLRCLDDCCPTLVKVLLIPKLMTMELRSPKQRMRVLRMGYNLGCWPCARTWSCADVRVARSGCYSWNACCLRLGAAKVGDARKRGWMKTWKTSMNLDDRKKVEDEARRRRMPRIFLDPRLYACMKNVQ